MKPSAKSRITLMESLVAAMHLQHFCTEASSPQSCADGGQNTSEVSVRSDLTDTVLDAVNCAVSDAQGCYSLIAAFAPGLSASPIAIGLMLYTPVFCMCLPSESHAQCGMWYAVDVL